MFFAGKGGVGKTTCSAAYALSAAPRPGRTLLVSTDPAHSLGDALGQTLSNIPARVTSRVDAVELDAPRAFARWLAEHRAALGDILEHGTWLDSTDIDALLDLSIPGIDELVGILEIARLAEGTKRATGTRAPEPYTTVVVDTAPTGHTLRLLSAPDTVGAVAAVLDVLQEPHRMIRDQLARVARDETSDRLIRVLAEQARQTGSTLRDAAGTSFRWVTLAEDLSLAESVDGVAALTAAGLSVTAIVVNRVLPDGGPCPLCDRRRGDQRRVIAAIFKAVGRGRRVVTINAAMREPRGVRALAALGHSATAVALGDASRAAKAAAGKGERSTAARAPHAGARLPFMTAIDRAQLLFFGGKGGVGKTTVAAATAVRLALDVPSRRVLLLSTDPAHSLADVFAAPVGDTPAPIASGPPNLRVRELDAPRALALRRADFEDALAEIGASLGVAADAAGGAAELMKLAPPGIDELFGMLSVVDARAEYDVIVVDTAPTGHALRLLEMPEAARDWSQLLLRVLLKYKALVRPGRLAAELVEVSKSIRELQTLLRDPVLARFIAVTRAAEVPRLETKRLLARLRRLHLSVPAIVVNAVTLRPGRCAICRAAASAERSQRTALSRLCNRRCSIIETPLVAPPPRGVAGLRDWAAAWI